MTVAIVATWIVGFVLALSVGIRERRASAWAAVLILAAFAAYVLRATLYGDN